MSAIIRSIHAPGSDAAIEAEVEAHNRRVRSAEYRTKRNMDEATKRQYTMLSKKVPLVLDWCLYKGDSCVAELDYEASIPAGKPIMAVYACMTKALNRMILFHVPWCPEKFRPHPDTDLQW